MDPDDLDPKRPTNAPVILESLSVTELEEYISSLNAEIARARRMIEAKRSVRAGADALFKL